MSKKLTSASKVKRRNRKGFRTEITLASGLLRSCHPYVVLGEGDKVLAKERGLYAVVDNGLSLIPISRIWKKKFFLDIGTRMVAITIKEIETAEELSAFQLLQKYHYKGATASGRTAPLIAKADDPLLPPILGFIELTSGLLVNSARRRIFDRPFHDKPSGVAWNKWSMEAAKKHTRRIARISRCVVYPEVRGLGISSFLAEAAAQFAASRWHFGGVKPLFLEITAEMLRYFPFVKTQGYAYVGETQGNGQRVIKDMQYLLQRSVVNGDATNLPKGGGGIMDLQRSYVSTLRSIMEKTGQSLESILNILRLAPEQLSDDQWIALHKIHRRPKPTYIRGLTGAATRFLESPSGLFDMPDQKRLSERTSTCPPNKNLLSIEGLRITTQSIPSTTPRARKIAEAFGVVSKVMSETLLSDLSFTVDSGDRVLITGPSGTGKSLLLSVIAQLISPNRASSAEKNTVHSDHVRFTGAPRIAILSPSRSDLSPIDLLTGTIEETLTALGAAGLAEAQLFVRPTKYFSDGQIHRFALARALCENPELLIADAFCESLDEFSAVAVCRRIRSHCARAGTALMVATADPRKVLSILEPTKIIRLLPGKICVVESLDVDKKRERT